MEKLVRLVKFAVSEFGPLLVFYAVNAAYGLRPAVVAAVAVSGLEIGAKLLRGVPFTGFFKFSVLATLVFGALDLTVKTPVFFRYEAAITNAITGVYFAMTIGAARSFIQEWVEKKNGKPIEDPNAILRCRMLTTVWAAYFFAKAAAYAVVSARYPLAEAMAIRATFGTASFYALLTISIFFGKRVLVFLQSKKLLPSA